jgi:hypothetical protein
LYQHQSYIKKRQNEMGQDADQEIDQCLIEGKKTVDVVKEDTLTLV